MNSRALDYTALVIALIGAVNWGLTALQKATTQNQTCVMAFCIFHVFKLL